MPPVYSGLHCQFLSHVLKALFFYLKLGYFCKKNAKFYKKSKKAEPPDQWRIQKILVGGIWSQNLKNSDVFTKVESDFSAEIGNSNVFFAQNQVVSEKKKKKGLHQNWDWFCGRIRYVQVGGGMHPEMEPNYSK